MEACPQNSLMTISRRVRTARSAGSESGDWGRRTPQTGRPDFALKGDTPNGRLLVWSPRLMVINELPGRAPSLGHPERRGSGAKDLSKEHVPTP